MKKLEFSFIIPTFNEQEVIINTLKYLYNSIKENKVTAEVIIIDDSTDSTIKILNNLKNNYANLKVIHRDNGSGVGSAIRLGLNKASGKYSIIYMADYTSEDLKCFPEMINRFREGYDIVQTSRFMKGMTIKGYPLKKTIANRLCNYFVRIAFLRFDLKDYTSLYKGIKTSVIQKLKLESDHFDLGTEIVLKAIRKKYKIIEVPVSWEERAGGESKLKLSKFAPKYLKTVMKIWLAYH